MSPSTRSKHRFLECCMASAVLTMCLSNHIAQAHSAGSKSELMQYETIRNCWEKLSQSQGTNNSQRANTSMLSNSSHL